MDDTRAIKLNGADGMRALACLMVMASHAFQRFNPPAQSERFQDLQLFFLQGSAGVSVFFVLSGFLLATPFWSAWLDGGGLPSLTNYAKRRAARIMPGYYLSLTLTFVISLLVIPDIFEPSIRFVAGLTFLAGFSWKTLFPVEINGPLWSISFEVFAYLLLPLFMLGLFKLPGLHSRRRPVLGFGWWLGVLVAVIGVNEFINQAFATDDAMKGWQFGIVGGAKYWMPHYNPWGFFGHYALGVLAAGVNTAWQRRRAAAAEKGGNSGSLAAEILVWGGAAAMAVLLWACRQAPDFSVSVGSQPYYFPWCPLAATVVLAGLPQSRWAWKVWDNSVGRFVARISFGLYIWHYLIMELLSLAWWPDYRQDFGIADPLKWGGITALALGTATLVAWLSWTFLEKPILEWAHRKA